GRTGAAERPTGVCYLSAHWFCACGGPRVPPARLALSAAPAQRTGSRAGGLETAFVSTRVKDPAQSALHRRVCLRTHDGTQVSRWATWCGPAPAAGPMAGAHQECASGTSDLGTVRS